MTSVHLKPWKEQSYGVSTSGYVEGSDRRIAVRVRSPHPDISDNGMPKLINFNGIAVGAESMRVPAEVAAGLGYAAITLDYSNTTDHITPLECNARDGLTVMDAFNADEYRLLGLSMGGAVATLAAAQSERPITNLDLVSPGGFIDKMVGVGRHTIDQALRRAMIDEMAFTLRYPQTAARMVISSLTSCSRRPMTTLAEAGQLFHETAYRHLVQLRHESPDTVVTLAHGSNDKLVPREELLASFRQHEAEEGISLVDVDVAYSGTHSTLVYRPELAQRVLLASSLINL